MRSTIEVYIDSAWVPAAEIETIDGHPHKATFAYLLDYVFGDTPEPVSLTRPVTSERLGFNADGEAPDCPSFLFDLVPQGRGRDFLCAELNLPNNESSDLKLAQLGAFNPIGNLRLTTAVDFYHAHSGPDAAIGFSEDDILQRREAFIHHLASHAMLAAGTTGVQGAAAKFLLTQDQDGRWFADAALPDDKARAHWLIKLPRGSHQTDLQILRNEAAYARVAQACGLRCPELSEFKEDMLFFRRFDREVRQGKVHRLHQESLASLAGVIGFGRTVSLFEQVEAFLRHVTHPADEVAEFIKRDILNLAMKNTDNHARNTAVRKLVDGTVQLTPVFDFAPMYKDREMIVRGAYWRKDGVEITRWNDIVASLDLETRQRADVLRRLVAFGECLETLPLIMRDADVDEEIIEDCKAAIEQQCKRIQSIEAPDREGQSG